MLNNELSQKLAHGEVGLSLLGSVIPISQSGQRSSPAIHTPPQAILQPIHNLSVSPAPRGKRGDDGQRDVHLWGLYKVRR